MELKLAYYRLHNLHNLFKKSVKLVFDFQKLSFVTKGAKYKMKNEITISLTVLKITPGL